MQQGKLGVDRVPFYASLWEQDPQGTERLITNLAAVTAPSAGSTENLGYPDPDGLGDVVTWDSADAPCSRS